CSPCGVAGQGRGARDQGLAELGGTKRQGMPIPETQSLKLGICATTPSMSWHGHGRGGRRGYHHGNLREALVEAALDLIGAKGPAGFTFAEAARHAGVSPAAPYRHYRDRDALLAEVARRGFT